MTLQTMEFKTEVRQILDLMIHSLYSHKEIFLRELISNASDAIDKARYESLTDRGILEEGSGWKIRISVDKNAGTITVSDNGIGMTRDEVIEALGTIAHSGTKEFLKALQKKEAKDNLELIGQFGVGFYSCFMVADDVTVISRKAGSEDKTGIKWESNGEGSFTVEDIEKEGKGTDVTLRLKKDAARYLEEWEIRSIIKRYSDYIEHPVVMAVEREKESELEKGKKYTLKEEEALNSGKAIWLRPRSEVPEEEYKEFYRHISHDFRDPARVIHFKSEGTSEFSALLYIPSQAPLNIHYKDYKPGPALYVKRVQIMEHCEDLIPPYLRFIKGVVDSSDLPLNVSREILQANKQVDIIRNNIIKKTLSALGEMKDNEYDKYLEFYREFSQILKEGIYHDASRKETIADLLLFPSTKTGAGAFTTFAGYVGGMKPGHEDVYYITGISYDEAVKSPYLEVFKEKDYEVLIMLDGIDDIIMGNLSDYRGKKLKSVIKGDIDLDKSRPDEREKEKREYGKLIDLINARLKDEVKEVRLSGRLKESPCCLVTDEGDVNPDMEKILRAMGHDVPPQKRILEINPRHPLFEAMKVVFEKDPDSAILKEYIGLLYDQALLLEGSRPKDPAAFTRAVARMMAEGISQTA